MTLFDIVAFLNVVAGIPATNMYILLYSLSLKKGKDCVAISNAVLKKLTNTDLSLAVKTLSACEVVSCLYESDDLAVNNYTIKPLTDIVFPDYEALLMKMHKQGLLTPREYSDRLAMCNSLKPAKTHKPKPLERWIAMDFGRYILKMSRNESPKRPDFWKFVEKKLLPQFKGANRNALLKEYIDHVYIEYRKLKGYDPDAMMDTDLVFNDRFLAYFFASKAREGSREDVQEDLPIFLPAAKAWNWGQDRLKAYKPTTNKAKVHWQAQLALEKQVMESEATND